MKKIFFILMFSTLFFSACSSDDNSSSGCEMKVQALGNGTNESGTYYSIQYGTSEDEFVIVLVSLEVYNFYSERWDANNRCWIGEVTEE